MGAVRRGTVFNMTTGISDIAAWETQPCCSDSDPDKTGDL